MKIPITGMIATAVLATSATSASAQTLGTALNYDILVQNGGVLELADSNQLFGQIGVSNESLLDAKKKSTTFDGTIFKHTGATIKDGAGLNPSGGIQSSASIDAALNQANADVAAYMSYLNGLSATTLNFGNVTTNFSYSSTMGTTVLDFTKIDLENETFTLNGRAGFSDQIIIRISDAFEFKAADLVLNNLDVDNVIWYYTGTSNLELHKSNSNPDLFMEFAGTVIAPNALVRVGEVDFNGRLYGTELKMGSGFKFEGAIPEPSTSLMLLLGSAALLLKRRRTH